MEYKTKLQRKKIYEKLTIIFELDLNWFTICGEVRRITRSTILGTYEEMLTNFPEIVAQKPKNKAITTHWWPRSDTKPRIKALKAAIELCK